MTITINKWTRDRRGRVSTSFVITDRDGDIIDVRPGADYANGHDQCVYIRTDGACRIEHDELPVLIAALQFMERSLS